MHKRLFEPNPEPFPTIAPKKEFCIALLMYKVKATIGEVGDMIGWESDNETVGPIAAACKQSLLRLVPCIIPDKLLENPANPFRLVLEHGDFGLHNMTIATDNKGSQSITSLYDWENASIVPAFLSDPEMAVIVDLTADKNANAKVTRIPEDSATEDIAEYNQWAGHYLKVVSSL